MKTAGLAVFLAFLVVIAGCASPADIDDTNANNPQTTLIVNTDEQRSPTTTTSTPTEQPPTTSTPSPTPNPRNTPTATPELDPEDHHIRVINGSPDPGLDNETLQNDTLHAVEFLAELSKNRTKRNRTVTQAATELCNAHNRVAPDNVSKASSLNEETYRNTYRVAHSAKVLHDVFGADIDVAIVNKRMRAVRKYSRTGSKVAPVIGSYNRLHNASCAVKRGESNAKEDFYVAAAVFAVDAALVQQQVAYTAAFKTTGVIARHVGLTRLARVCGYKCVGLVESELHWALRGTYHGSHGYLTEEAVTGNLTSTGYDEDAEQRVTDYLEQHDRTVVDGVIADGTTVRDCFESNFDPSDLLQLGGELLDVAKHYNKHGEFPDDVKLEVLTQAEDVEQCVTEHG